LNTVQVPGINVNIVHFQGEGNVNDVVYARPRPAAQGEVLDRNALFLGPAIRHAGERGRARQARAAGHAEGQWFDKTGSRGSSKKERKPSDARLGDTQDDTDDPFDQPSIGAVTLMRVVLGFPACAGMQGRTLR